MTTKRKSLPEIPKLKLPWTGEINGEVLEDHQMYRVTYLCVRHGTYSHIATPWRVTERGAILAARKVLGGVKP